MPQVYLSTTLPTERKSIIARTSTQSLLCYAQEDQPLALQVIDANHDERLELPNPDDRHVLAAIVGCRSGYSPQALRES